MSTRCHIVIYDEDDNKHYIYHHHDGYPEGVGLELKKILESCPSYDWETIMEKILACDSEYEEDTGIHGDEDYIYYINTKNYEVSLRCNRSDGHMEFYEEYPKLRSDLDKKYKSLPYNTSGEKLAFLDGVAWVENFPTTFIIKKVLEAALNTSQDLSGDLNDWAEYIKKKLENGG